MGKPGHRAPTLLRWVREDAAASKHVLAVAEHLQQAHQAQTTQHKLAPQHKQAAQTKQRRKSKGSHRTQQSRKATVKHMAMKKSAGARSASKAVIPLKMKRSASDTVMPLKAMTRNSASEAVMHAAEKVARAAEQEGALSKKEPADVTAAKAAAQAVHTDGLTSQPTLTEILTTLERTPNAPLETT